MALTVRDALQLDVMKLVRIVVGRAGLDRQIRWVHIIDIPEITPWLHGGELLLTTGYGWPRGGRRQARLVSELNRIGLAALLIETGPFFQRIPRAIRRAADEAGMPLLEAPWKLPFVDITEAIDRAIIRDQYELLERSEAIHRSLTLSALEARDLQDIAITLCHLIRKSVSIEDRDFRLLAHAEHESEVDEVRAQTIVLAKTPGEVLAYLDAQGILDRLQQAMQPVHVQGRPDLGMANRVVCPIRIAGELVGYVWILEGDTPLNALDLRAAEHAATVAALHILRQQSLAAAEARVRYTFIDALIREEYAHVQGLLERARLLGFTPEGGHLVGVCAILSREHRASTWALKSRDDLYLREQLGQRLVAALTQDGYRVFHTYALNQVILVLEVDPVRDGARGRIQRGLESVLKDLAPGTVAIALGRPHQGLDGVARSCREANLALRFCGGQCCLVWAEDLVLPRVLAASGDHDALLELHAMVFRTLPGLPHGHALVQTVQALLRQGFNQAAAARELGIHRNTLRQRLARIEEALGASLTDWEVRMRLHLANEVERLNLLAPDPRGHSGSTPAIPQQP